ncbi:MAG: hypothetical protein Q9213_004144 [Squamulea squamosa]
MADAEKIRCGKLVRHQAKAQCARHFRMSMQDRRTSYEMKQGMQVTMLKSMNLKVPAIEASVGGTSVVRKA